MPEDAFHGQRLVEFDADGRRCAGYDENSPERLNSRDGCRDRPWEPARLDDAR